MPLKESHVINIYDNCPLWEGEVEIINKKGNYLTKYLKNDFGVTIKTISDNPPLSIQYDIHEINEPLPIQYDIQQINKPLSIQYNIQQINASLNNRIKFDEQPKVRKQVSEPKKKNNKKVRFNI